MFLYLQILLSLAFGALGGYLASTYTPVQSQVAIVDVHALFKRAVDTGSAKSEEDAKRLANQVKEATDDLAAQGIVVIDADAIINAPKEAYVDVRLP